MTHLLARQSSTVAHTTPWSLLFIGQQSIPTKGIPYAFILLPRSHQLELTTPGDMVYLKHSPAMRSYVVLRGTVLLTNSVMDREGVEVSRNDFLGKIFHRRYTSR